LAPFGQAVSEKKIFLTLANQKQELPLAAIFVGGMGRNEETLTWPLLLKIEHMVKLHVFGNNSKTVNNIRNLTWVKMISTGRSNYPEILKKIKGNNS
jgi:hypothetical protein